MSMETPPGWYPAPDASDLMRYWDGEMWTEQARPAPAGRAGPASGHTGRPALSVQRSPVVLAALQDGEIIEAGFHGTTPYRPMIFIATGQRILIFDPSGFRRRYTIHSYGFDEVESVGYSSWTGTNITLSGKTYKCSTTDGTAMSDFTSYIRSRLPRTGPIDLDQLPPPDDGAGQHTPLQGTGVSGVGKAGPATDDSLAGQIVRIAELHSQGILTDEEFIAAKAKLLELER